MDGIAAVSQLLEVQYSARRDEFAAWRAALGELATRTQGRMLTPSPGTLPFSRLRDEGPSLATCVHEWITTRQNQGEEYCRQLERRYAPYAAMFNRQFVGTYHEI